MKTKKIEKTDLTELASALYNHLLANERHDLFQMVMRAHMRVGTSIDDQGEKMDRKGKDRSKKFTKLCREEDLIAGFGCALEMEQF